MQQLFGNLIPDVEFVIASSDRPMVPRHASEEERLPVFRFCSSPVRHARACLLGLAAWHCLAGACHLI
eukprot:366024-Chlamydomonas_euryale.AAC.18